MCTSRQSQELAPGYDNSNARIDAIVRALAYLIDEHGAPNKFYVDDIARVTTLSPMVIGGLAAQCTTAICGRLRSKRSHVVSVRYKSRAELVREHAMHGPDCCHNAYIVVETAL